MANFSAKCSIMTQEMVDSFCESFYIPAEVHPTAPGRDKTIAQFPAGKVGVYTRIFDVCGYRIPFTKFFMAVLKYFRVHISQLSPFGAARVSHFEVLTRVLDLSPSVTVFRAFYTRTYSDGLFSFAKRSTLAPSCFPKPPDSIKNWADHFFWVDSCVFPISVPLYTGGVLEKDSAPHLTARQEQTVKLLESYKAPFRRYPECSLCLVGLSPYYPFDKKNYPDFDRPDRTIWVCWILSRLLTLKRSGRWRFSSVDVSDIAREYPACLSSGVLAAGGSSSVAATEIPAPIKGGQEDVAEENAYLELADPDEGTAMARQSEEEVVTERPKKIKKKRLIRQNDDLFDLECKTNDWKRILYDAPINKAECFDPGSNNDKIDDFLAIKVPLYIEEGYYDSEGDILYLENLLSDDNTHNLSPEVFFDHEPQHDTFSPKSDPLHHEFAGGVITIPPRLVREHEDYISRMSLLCGNSSSWSPKNFHPIIESLPTSTTLIKDSDSNREEIDIFSGPDDSIPPGGGEINVEVDNSFTFVTPTFLPYLTYPEVSPLLSSTENEDTIFDPDISI
ncbi:hypothetical protein Tco_1100202 [Tanacetum coccineum]